MQSMMLHAISKQGRKFCSDLLGGTQGVRICKRYLPPVRAGPNLLMKLWAGGKGFPINRLSCTVR